MKLKLQFIIFAICALSISVAYAHNQLRPPLSQDLCKTIQKKNVDLRKEFGPIREQGQVGWCYAYAGADILGHWLYKKKYTVDPTKPEGMVSATDLAIQYLYSKNGENPGRSKLSAKWQDLPVHLTAYEEQIKERARKETATFGSPLTVPDQDINEEAMRILGLADSGQPLDSILSGVSGGVCFEKDLPSQTKASDYTESAGEVLQKSLKKYYSGSQGLFSRALCAYDLIQVFPGLDFSIIEHSLRNAHMANPVLFLSEMTCRRRILDHGKPSLQHQDIGNAHTAPSLLSRVDEKLESRIPLAVTYGSAIFDYQGPYMSSQIAKSSHASVIVGKRYDCKAQKWNYLVRNSWGVESCLANQKTFQEKYKNPAPYTCDQGHFVVPSDLLELTMRSVDWLE